ncbi:3598_t:CDS:2, partial [Racocetra fulgida]
VPHPEEISDEDELYYLFSIHDTNQDGYLDGHELRGAFTDDHEDSDNTNVLKMEEIVEMIDHALLEDDMNNEFNGDLKLLFVNFLDAFFLPNGVGDTDAIIEDNERLEPRERRFAAGSEFDI